MKAFTLWIKPIKLDRSGAGIWVYPWINVKFNGKYIGAFFLGLYYYSPNHEETGKTYYPT